MTPGAVRQVSRRARRTVRYVGKHQLYPSSGGRLTFKTPSHTAIHRPHGDQLSPAASVVAIGKLCVCNSMMSEQRCGGQPTHRSLTLTILNWSALS
jgi:hypothetical protein